MSTDELPVKRHRGTLVDARLHLLDRQLLDSDGAPVGIVDDLELDGIELGQDIVERSEAPQVSAAARRLHQEAFVCDGHVHMINR